MAQCVLITGCSGGGKSSLLAALAAKGHAVVPEPGRRIVAEEQTCGGNALPWVNAQAFALRAVAMAASDLQDADDQSGHVFFDRGLIDAAVALQHVAGGPLAQTLGDGRHYIQPVFLAPPWPEIYETDPQRRHGFDDAVAEYDRIAGALDALGYQVAMLPKASVQDRVSFVLQKVGGA